MKGEQFSRNRKRPARAARDEKFSISRTIIVALAAFTADARFQSRRPPRPVECILFTIPRAGQETVTRARGTVQGEGKGVWRDRKIAATPREISYFPAVRWAII